MNKYDEADWKQFSLNHAETVVKDTRPVNFEDAETKIRALYLLLNLPQPKHFIHVKHPLEMFSLQLYIEGKVPPYERLNDVYGLFGDVIDALPKNPIPYTPELVEYALALAWMREQIVNDPLGRFDADELTELLASGKPSDILGEFKRRYYDQPLYVELIMKLIVFLMMLFENQKNGEIPTLCDVVDFENEEATGIKLDSYEDDIFNFVKQVEDKIEEILRQGYYTCGGHKVQLEGWPTITNTEDFNNITFCGGNLSVWTSDIEHLCQTFGFRHPIMEALIEISKSTHYWMAYGDPDGDNGYVILCDTPHTLEINGPDSRRHNEDGPAIGYDGFELYYWNDTLIPPHFLSNDLDYKTITNEQNAEMRRILFEIFGYGNWLEATNATIRDEDLDPQTGFPRRLYETTDERGETLHVLECQDGTMKNGVYQKYYILTDRELMTCAESVANSYGTTPQQYAKALFRT